MKAKLIFFVIGMMVTFSAYTQSILLPIEFGGGTSYSVVSKDTTKVGQANNFDAHFVFRSKNINVGVSSDFTSGVFDTCANDRLKIRGFLANGQSGYLGNGNNYYEKFSNEISVGYEFFWKSDHYLTEDHSKLWKKEATTHSLFVGEKFGISADGASGGTFKVFRQQEISLMGMYSFSERLCTTFGGDTIKSPLASEDKKSFFYDLGYRAEVMGIGFRSGKAGIGINFMFNYTNITPFGCFPGYRVGGSISLSSYAHACRPIEVYYRYSGYGDGLYMNEVGVSVDICGLYYTFRK